MKKCIIKNKKNSITIKKIISLIILLVVIYSGTGLVVRATEETVDVMCNDYNLYQSLKENIPSDYLVTSILDGSNDDGTYTLKVKAESMSAITSLKLNGSDSRKITDLTGIENFTYLTNLDLNTNNISDISKLSNLTSLDTLNMSKNIIDNIAPIAGLTNLTNLNLSGNKIKDITSITSLSKLLNLNLSSNSISTITAIQSLSNLQVLDLSSNTSISNIDDALVQTLTSLNLSNTAITKIDPDGNSDYIKILTCTNLKELKLAGCKITDMSNLFKTEKVTVDGLSKNLAILRGIQILDLSNTGITSFSNIKTITELKELYLKSNGISSLSGIEQLEKLEYINLDNNKINDSGLAQIRTTTTQDGQTVTKAISPVKQISMKNNLIANVTPLGYLNEIEYLDLSENKVQSIAPIERFSFSKGINLRNQSIDMPIFKKSIDENHYIILLNILQSAKNPSSVAYNVNSYYTTNGVTMNDGADYQVAPYYNVIITPDKTSSDSLSVTVHGGITDGSTINFKMSTSTAAYESLRFEDKNLDEAIYNDLVRKLSTTSYIARAPYIINITQSEIKNTKDLQLASGNIEKLKGLANFSNLEILNLADNKVSNDTEIKSLTKLKTLNLANNQLNNSYTSIENLYALTKLNLVGNNIQDLNSIAELINNINNGNNLTCKLTDLSLSDNKLKDISILSNVPTLTNLYLSNNEIEDIEPLKGNTSLRLLDVSRNQLIDIDAVGNLTSLETLNISNNIVKNIDVISNLSLYTLDISSNRIADISAISNQISLTTLNISNNKIEDVYGIESLLIKNEFKANQQKIAKALTKDQTGTVSIALPPIFLSAKDSASKVYTNTNYYLENCTLSEDGQSIVVNTDELGNNIAKAKIVGGQADGTTLSVANALVGTISYSTEEKTKDNVVATISFNRNGATVLNNDGKTTYTFTQNGEFTFEYVDENGFDGSETAKVDWIDNQGPQAQVQYSTENITKDGVLVTITTDETIQDVTGWEFTNAEKTQITKTFTENTTNTTITLKDILGNESKVQITIQNIDTTSPTIQGIENGKTYNQAVKPTVTDENLSSVTLKKDGTIVTGYQNGNSISENGQYELQAVDAAGNTTTVTFKIEIIVNDKVESNKYAVDDSNKFIDKVLPNTNLSNFKNNISSEATYKVVDKNGKEIMNTGKVTTGSKVITQTGKEYVISVMGDLNGDGEISISDLSILAKTVVGSRQLDGVYKMAADVTGDNQIKISDLSKLAKVQVGILRFE